MRHRLTIAAFMVVMLAPGPGTAYAQRVQARGKRVAVLPFDALGMDPGRVQRLEALFRNEIDRLAQQQGPSRRAAQAILRDRRLANCSGVTACLAEIGTKLESDYVVSGNVAALGDSYVVNIKAIDVTTAAEVGRIASDPLRGEPDELIEAVRVAAYRLLAPDRLRGAVVLLADVDDAEVRIDGRRIGKTPLEKPIVDLTLGNHELSVTKPGHSDFRKQLRIRFQKTTKVIVRLNVVQRNDLVSAPIAAEPEESRWYQSPWFLVGVGVTAAVAGVVVGSQLGNETVVDCSGGMCAP